MDKIIVKFTSSDLKVELEYEDIEEAVTKYNTLKNTDTIKSCELSVVTQTVLKAFNR